VDWRKVLRFPAVEGPKNPPARDWEVPKYGDGRCWDTNIYPNTIEGVFSLLQRGVMGTFHSASRKHLPNYLNEFQFLWNTRKMDDGGG
jgi:hypothetical protein